MTKKELLSRVMQLPGVTTTAQAEQVVTAVFQTLRDRILPEEADDVWAQLPTDWKKLWESDAWWERVTEHLHQVHKLHRDEFIAWVRGLIAHDIPADQAVKVVFHALKEQISPGETSNVTAQLPEDLKTLWKAA